MNIFGAGSKKIGDPDFSSPIQRNGDTAASAVTESDLSTGYAAFISYSHADSRFARWLHTSLETYRLPRSLQGSNRSATRPADRLGRFFRDEDELGSSSALTPQIEAALAASAALIVICSPAAARSKWVAREIFLFKQRFPSRPVLAVIVEGIPNHPEHECFPEPLRYAVTKNGELALKSPQEPLAPDLQKTDREIVKLKLISGLLGISFDLLIGRERRRTRRRMAIAGAATIAIVGALTAAAASAYVSAQTANAERARADRERDRAVVQRDIATRAKSEAELATEQAQSDEALAKAATARATLSAQLERLATARAEAATIEALKQQKFAEVASLDAQRREVETLATQALAAHDRGDDEQASALVGQLLARSERARTVPLAQFAVRRTRAVPVTRLALPESAAAREFIPAGCSDLYLVDARQRLVRVAGSDLDTFGLPASAAFVIGCAGREIAFLSSGERVAVAPTSDDQEKWLESPRVPSLVTLPRERKFVVLAGLQVFEGNWSQAANPLTPVASLQENSQDIVELVSDQSERLIAARTNSGFLRIFDRGRQLNLPFEDLVNYRFKKCVSGNLLSDFICQDHEGTLWTIDVDQMNIAAFPQSLGTVQSIAWNERGFHYQTSDGSTGLVTFAPRNSGEIGEAPPPIISAVQTGRYSDTLAQVINLDRGVSTFIFTGGLIQGYDLEQATELFTTSLREGIADAQLDPNGRRLLVIGLDGSLFSLDLHNVWESEGSDDSRELSLDLGSRPFESVDRERAHSISMALYPVSDGRETQLLWFDGRSRFRVSRVESGDARLSSGDGGSWKLPDPVRAARIFSQQQDETVVLAADKRAYILREHSQSEPLNAEVIDLKGTEVFASLVNAAGDCLLIGLNGYILVSNGRVFRFTTGWPFREEPVRFVFAERGEELILISQSGRRHRLDVLTGNEIGRGFTGGPAS